MDNRDSYGEHKMVGDDEQENVSLKLKKLRLGLNEERRRIEKISPVGSSCQFDAPRGFPSNIQEISLAQVCSEIESQREQMKEQCARIETQNAHIDTQREEIETQREKIENLQNTVTDVKKTCHERHGVQREDQRPLKKVDVKVDVDGSGKLDKVQAFGEVNIDLSTHHHLYRLDSSSGSFRQATETAKEWSLRNRSSGVSQAEQPSKRSSNLVSAGVELEDLSFLDGLQVKENLQVEDTEKGLKVILKIPSKTKLELHVFTEEDTSKDTHIFYMKNKGVWSVTIENIQKCVWIGVNKPNQSHEIYSFLEEIVAKYPPCPVQEEACASGETAEASCPNPYIVEKVNLEKIPSPVLQTKTKSNILYILLIACTDHDDLATVSGHLDKKRMES